MEQDDYTKAILEKMDDNNEIMCEDCGKKTKIGHGIIEHNANTVRLVCGNCFNGKYRKGLYPSYNP